MCFLSSANVGVRFLVHIIRDNSIVKKREEGKEDGGDWYSKKKREHIVFDQMLKPKKSIPFSMVNKQSSKSKKKK